MFICLFIIDFPFAFGKTLKRSERLALRAAFALAGEREGIDVAADGLRRGQLRFDAAD